ncbi:tubulin--tyrosine ligase family protein [Miltoncostaea marina]|uniref:tubulin--tyrosine ligase family protein n=1 Tax=Miltoncostaea marina TaxID=2843215 RepID=UPI001C3E7B54|nr:tubulin--tyrosine ligase family protein [Miltoncostaea marina]
MSGAGARTGAPPTALLIYPDEWLGRRRKEWAPLASAAAAAGMTAVVAGWRALAVEGGRVRAGRCRVQHPGGPLVTARGVARTPAVVLTTWGVDWGHAPLFDAIVGTSGCRHTQSSLLGWLDGKCELERCLRAREAATGARIPRPRTLLPDEAAAEEGGGLVIVKPSRSGQCRGIEIVPRDAAAAMAAEVAAGARAPFVAQDLVADAFLYRGRRWDARVHAMATSLDPLEVRVYREGVAKTTAAPARPGSGRLDEWLNAESHRPGGGPAENLPLTEMLAYVEREHRPLPGFWRRLEALAREVFAAIAGAARDWPRPQGRALLVAGLDLIVERRGDDGYELRLLEINSHPGLGWEPRIAAALAPHHRAWFADMRAAAGGPP